MILAFSRLVAGGLLLLLPLLLPAVAAAGSAVALFALHAPGLYLLELGGSGNGDSGAYGVELFVAGNADQDLLVDGVDAWEPRINQLKHETYEDEDAWATMLDGQLGFLMDVIDYSGAPVTDGMRTRRDDLQGEWAERQAEMRQLTELYIEPINAWARQQQLGHIVNPVGSD